MADIKDFAVVDLFCGVGGLTHGFVKEGFTVSAGVDFDETCGYAYEANNNSKFVYKDITGLTAEDLNHLFPNGKRKILVGCAPCQPFSIFNYKNNNNAQKQREDTKWKLLYSFADLIEMTKPEIVSMENVPQLKNFNRGKVLRDFINRLESSGYHVTHEIHNAQDYGVPQRRKRLVLFASKHTKFEMTSPTHKDNYVTVRQTIGQLPEIEDGQHCKSDFLHYARKLQNLSRKRIRATPEGGSWLDWEEELMLECHKKGGGQMYRSVYGRMSWDDVAPTLTTYCTGLNNGRFGHPQQDRAISIREAALLQSFPPNYKLLKYESDFKLQTLARHIGNAVPVKLGQAIARSIQKHIQNISD